MAIRAATRGDLAAMQEIERAAGAAFSTVGMPEIADDEPFTTEELMTFLDRGHAWVTDDDGLVVAYLVADLLDGDAHVDQVSVHPDAARRGLGRDLVEHLAGWAAERGVAALTLTTFRDVPWNAPYYERLGFSVLPSDRWGPQLRATVASEAQLEASGPRVVMRRALAPAG
jgi:GNAT superfamily N-acetyltransferase